MHVLFLYFFEIQERNLLSVSTQKFVIFEYRRSSKKIIRYSRYVITYIWYFHFFHYDSAVRQGKRKIRIFFSLQHTILVGGGRKQTRNLSGNRERTDLGNSGHGETNDAKKGRTNKVGTRMTLQAWGIYFGGGIPMDQFHRKNPFVSRRPNPLISYEFLIANH